jgi:cytochrome b
LPAEAHRRDTTIKVWGPLVRVGHWSLALGVACAWLTKNGWGLWHERVGYAAAAIALIRVIAGLWGLERLHSLLADSLLVLITLHVVGVLFGAYRHRENLVAAMFHGRKRGVD